MIFYSFLSKPYPYASEEDASALCGVVTFHALGESYHHWIVKQFTHRFGGFIVLSDSVKYH